MTKLATLLAATVLAVTPAVAQTPTDAAIADAVAAAHRAENSRRSTERDVEGFTGDDRADEFFSRLKHICVSAIGRSAHQSLTNYLEPFVKSKWLQTATIACTAYEDGLADVPGQGGK